VYLVNFVTLGWKEVNGVNQQAYPSTSFSGLEIQDCNSHYFSGNPQEAGYWVQSNQQLNKELSYHSMDTSGRSVSG